MAEAYATAKNLWVKNGIVLQSGEGNNISDVKIESKKWVFQQFESLSHISSAPEDFGVIFQQKNPKSNLLLGKPNFAFMESAFCCNKPESRALFTDFFFLPSNTLCILFQSLCSLMPIKEQIFDFL